MSAMEEPEGHRPQPLYILQVLAIFQTKKRIIPSTFHFEMLPFVDAIQEGQINHGVYIIRDGLTLTPPLINDSILPSIMPAMFYD